LEVRNTVAKALMRDRMPSMSVLRRMQEDDRLTLSLGSIHTCFLWAHEQINMETHWECVRTNLSGVLCIDEVHDSGRTILFATDPLGDFTVSFKLVEKNDQDPLDAFLQALKERGLDARGIITDGAPLYKDALQSYWADVEHQLCVFHVIKDVNKLILDGGTRHQKSSQTTRPQRTQEASGASEQDSPTTETASRWHEQKGAGHLHLGASRAHCP
jgi:transposase-like protein